MNIRHNNMEGKNAIEYVKNLSDEQMEEWYDETYQMLLLCFLEYDNIERNKKISKLKEMIENYIIDKIFRYHFIKRSKLISDAIELGYTFKTTGADDSIVHIVQ